MINQDKYLLPWVELEKDACNNTLPTTYMMRLFKRPHLDSGNEFPNGLCLDWISIAYHDIDAGDGLAKCWRSYHILRNFNTKEEAIRETDKILIREGYIFITSEDAERLMVLL